MTPKESRYVRLVANHKLRRILESDVEFEKLQDEEVQSIETLMRLEGRTARDAAYHVLKVVMVERAIENHGEA